MRNRRIKGEPGYFKYRKINLLKGVISGLIIIILFFFIGYMIYGTPKNILTIPAVITVLPTAKIYVHYMLLPWKCNADAEYLNQLKLKYPGITFYSELLITGADTHFEIMYLAIGRDDTITAYTSNTRSDSSKFEKAVVNFLNYYNFNAKVKLLCNLNDFENELMQYMGAEEPDDNEKNHITTIFEKISIMSI